MNIIKEVVQNVTGHLISEDAFLTFRHYRIGDGFGGYAAKGGITFCVVADPDNCKLYVSVAECSTKDLFNRKIGRSVSAGRLLIGNYIQLDWDRRSPIAENLEYGVLQLGNVAFHNDDYVLSTKAHRYA